MKQPITLKRIWSVFLTLAAVLALSVTSTPVYAAEGGTISVKYDPQGVSITEPTQFELYRVGDFGRDADGNVTINLTSAFAVCGVDLNGITPPDKDASQEEIDAWNNQWLAKANDLGSWVKGLEDSDRPDTAWEGTLASGSDYQALTDGSSATQFENGIYLLIGYEQRVDEYYWAPVPVLIMVLNNDVRFDIVDSESGNVIKTERRPVTYKHVLKKIWDDEGHEAARPESIDVDILYSGKNIDTVTLSADNDWSYIWYSQEAPDKRSYSNDGIQTKVLNADNDYKIPLPEGDGLWEVSEQQSPDLNYYSWSIDYKAYEDDTEEASPADSVEYFTITNKYETRRVRIRKNLINYLNHNDGKETYANATVVFEITGYAGSSDEPAYHNKVGMTFTKTGKQEIVLNNIPVKVTRVTVEEVYCTNYRLVGENPITKDIEVEGDVIIETEGEGADAKQIVTFVFDFENDYDGPPSYGSGIVNKYDNKSQAGSKPDYRYKGITDTSDIYNKPEQR